MENPALPVPNSVIELRNSAGVIIQEQRTNATGQFVFNGLTDGNDYNLDVAVGRMQRSSPGQRLLQPNNAVGAANFGQGGIPAKISVIAPDDTLVIFTTYTITTQAAPPSNSTTFDISASIRNNKTPPDTVALPPELSFFMSCWEPTQNGINVVYIKGASVQVNGGNPIDPLGNYTVTCP